MPELEVRTGRQSLQQKDRTKGKQIKAKSLGIIMRLV